MPKRCLGDYISWLEDSSEVSEIKTQEKTQKLKEKTQKVGTFGIPGCRKSVQTISLVYMRGHNLF